ncbi:hypothetical protein [Prevotella aurantiaca]|uniref:hypothetical protein n=1 Tax=Prevotella aurantiaca TaxID=596085 RepID=UPI001CAAC403|nr:hypothetical protein [Prevotella aurantiaca]MBF1387056.1 hypothetical protein [Prevotella aurantiaca]
MEEAKGSERIRLLQPTEAILKSKSHRNDPLLRWLSLYVLHARLEYELRGVLPEIDRKEDDKDVNIFHKQNY